MRVSINILLHLSLLSIRIKTSMRFCFQMAHTA